MEFEELGAHCTVCRFRDYLPIKCAACKKSFCSEHGAADAHACASARKDRRWEAGETPAARIRQNKRCAERKCKTREVIQIFCKGCGQQYCLKHRLEADHACSKKLLDKQKHIPTADKFRNVPMLMPVAISAESS